MIACFCINIHAFAESVKTHGADEYLKAVRLFTGLHIAEETVDNKKVLFAQYDGDYHNHAVNEICDEYNIHTFFYSDENDMEKDYVFFKNSGIPVSYNEKMKIDEDPWETEAWGFMYTNMDWLKNRVMNNVIGYENKPIKVAVIDSGIDYTHPMLKNRVDIEKGYDFFDEDSDCMDEQSHGTHVSGIIAGCTTNNVELIPIKITNKKGETYTILFKMGLQHAIEKNADVINISLAGNEDREQQDKNVFSGLFDEAEKNGITVCVAAGNGKHNAEYIFPAYMDTAITVSNIDSNGEVYNSSNYGNVIDIAAPGVKIYSTVLNGDYEQKTGTSMSCPFVSAAAAMLKTMDKTITPAQVEYVLKTNAKPFSKQYDEYYGVGILNLKDLKMSIIKNMVYKDGVITADIDESEIASEPDPNIIIAGFSEKRLSDILLKKAFDGSGDNKLMCNVPDIYDSIHCFVWDTDSMKPYGIKYILK